MEDDHYAHGPSKRRRISLPRTEATKPKPATYVDASSDGKNGRPSEDVCEDDGQENISINATTKVAGQAVAPFLAKHIPGQYAPTGRMTSVGKLEQKDLNTKFCYRHRPDLKCRRQANEPSMAQLQSVSLYDFFTQYCIADAS